ncbi:18511_t:CDS:10, partial [Gigaspora margarita]
TEQYFKTTPTNEWSYLGYLEAMKSYYQRYATIISLKSTWRKSFLTALRSIERSQDREQSEAATFLLNKKSNKQEIMEYWKSVEKERRLVMKQLDVKNNTQISALNMLNVATTDQSCQVIRLLEEQSNTQAPNDCFTEMQQHARSFDNKEGTKHARIHKCEQQECVVENLDNSENDYNDDDYETDDDIGENSPTVLAFTDMYENMEDDKKWRLSTGKIVEDALYDFASKCSHEHASHSLIIDPTDKLYVDNDVFTKEELKEIGAYKRRSLPEIPDDLFDYLRTFAKDTLHELRHAIDQPIKVIQGNFNPKKHHDYDWIRYVMHTIVQEYEVGSLRKNHLEQWYNMHLWCAIVDRCFADVDDLNLIHGESCSVASGIRKNVNRTIPGVDKMERQKVGRKESGLKLPKLLKDMLVQLASEVEWSTVVLRNLTTVGFVHADCRQMLLELDCPEGYVCRLSRGDVYKVADSITTHITETLPLIVTTWRAKAAIRDCVNKVQRRLVEVEEVLELIRCAGSMKFPGTVDNRTIIPTCFETPLKCNRRRQVKQ